MQKFVPLRYDFYYIGGSSNVITDSSSSSSVHGAGEGEGGGGGSAPTPLKTYSPHLYYLLSTKLLILLRFWTFPKFAVFFYKRPLKPLTLANKA